MSSRGNTFPWHAEILRSPSVLCDLSIRLFTDEELAGLPAGFINSLQVVDGKRKVTLAYPHTIPILRNCRVAATRKKVRVHRGCVLHAVRCASPAQLYSSPRWAP